MFSRCARRAGKVTAPLGLPTKLPKMFYSSRRQSKQVIPSINLTYKKIKYLKNLSYVIYVKLMVLL